jgi:hypothetical protein
MKHARTILAVAVPATLALVAGLSGCDDDDSGPGMASGVLIDALVTGINYRCGSATTTTGTTTAAGVYTCPANESVSFYVGDILVGSIPVPLPKATPLDLAGDGSTASDPEVTAITRFLMSISSTDPNTGTITIPASVHTAAAGKAVDWTTVAPGILDSTITTIAPAGSTLYSDSAAQAHLTASINSLFVGTYSGTFSGAAAGSWQLAIAANGAVTGTYTPNGDDAGSLSGTMLPTLTTGGRYTFNGEIDSGAQWSGYLDVATGAFVGTWSGDESQGTYTGRKQ